MGWLSKISEGQNVLVKNSHGIRIRKVTRVTENRIYCDSGEYSRITGIRYNSSYGEHLIEATPELFKIAKNSQESALLKKRIANCKLSELDIKKLIQIAEIMGV